MKFKFHNQRGFTLIEVAVSITIFSIAIIGLVSMASAIQYSQRSAQYQVIAKETTVKILENYRNAPISTVQNGDYNLDTLVPASLPDGHAIGRVEDSGIPDTKKLTAIVTYSVGTTTRTSTMTSYSSDGGFPQ